MKKYIIISFLFLMFTMVSCDLLQDVSKSMDYDIPGMDLPLTESEVAAGIKEALRVSTDTAVSIVSHVDGYYKDELLKILLPKEADVIVDNKNNPLLKAVGISDLLDDVVLRMNRAAENAAKEATPIFVNAITSMSVKDAFDILNGSDTSATHYFRKKTYHQLKHSFKPKIKTSLDKKIVGNISANQAWSGLTEAYNQVAKMVPNWKTVNTELDEYVTDKALKGLFIKVADQEKQIRRDPLARVTDILERVFGK